MYRLYTVQTTVRCVSICR